MEYVPFPCVVKPCCGGSSVGVSIAHNEKEFEEALDEAFSYEDTVLVEEFVDGREFSVAVLDGKALPVIEIEPLEGFYDYKNKYRLALPKRHALPIFQKILQARCSSGQKNAARQQA
ncbi:MAG: ATP-grasp domain-containing protein [Lachnospira eligens]